MDIFVLVIFQNDSTYNGMQRLICQYKKMLKFEGHSSIWVSHPFYQGCLLKMIEFGCKINSTEN